MSRKLRPDNGPGSNGLRGGIKTYSPKTTTGPWMEEFGGPALYKRGFSTSEFQTEAQYAQSGVLGQSYSNFGSGLPLKEVVVKKTTTAELFNPSTTRSNQQWQTNTQIMNSSIINRTKPEDTMLVPVLSRTKLEEYRRSWTCDTEVGRKFRFQTESRLAGNAASDKFQVTCLRFLPGSPKALEEYRNRVIERYGIFGISAIKYFIGAGRTLTVNELRNSLHDCGVDIKTYELNQIVAYISPTTTVESDEFIRVMRGSMTGFDAKEISKVFATLMNNSGGDDTVDLEFILSSLSTERYPEVREGFLQFLPAYTGGAETVSEQPFIDFHEDLFLCCSSSVMSGVATYNAIVRSIWKG